MPPVNPFLRCLRGMIFLLLFVAAATQCPAQEPPPSPLETQVAPGIAALKSGDLDSAEKIFSSALRHGIKHPLVYHNLGVIAQMRGQHLEAVQRFREALALRPNYGASRLLLGASFLALGRNTEAVRELQRAVRLMPQQPQARLQLAKAYEASEDWIAAVQQLQKLVELDPQEPEYAYQMVKAWMRLSGWSYQQIARINPNSPRLQQGLGQEYAVQEKYDLALAAFQRAAEADPHLPEVHLAIGSILLEQKKYDQALAETALELKLVPQSKAAVELKTKIENAKAGSAP
jgi:tetratricopeptide (TPR) repeat protein